MAFSERLALIALNRVPGVGAVRAKALEAAFGSFEEAAKASEAAIVERCADVGPAMARAMRQALVSQDWAEQEVARAERASTRILVWSAPEYPRRLRESPAPPLCLYCIGDLALLGQTQIAVIGTRRASVYGLEQAQRFALRLAEAGVHVTSGLAEGIDSAAHEGALMAKGAACGKTLAVIGAALDCIYPASRKPLARQIIQNRGLVVSEYAFGRHADAKTFPRRNRIVAALCHGALIAEAPLHSGTLITASFAKQYGRPRYALPGRLDWPSFAGNHAWIRAGDARLAVSPEDILEELGTLPLGDAPHETARAPVGLTEEERAIWNAAGAGGISIDALCARTGLPLPKVLELVMVLQMRRLLRPLPGGLVRKA